MEENQNHFVCSIVNQSFATSNLLIGGVPAKELKVCRPWTDECRADVEECERLKSVMGLYIRIWV